MDVVVRLEPGRLSLPTRLLKRPGKADVLIFNSTLVAMLESDPTMAMV